MYESTVTQRGVIFYDVIMVEIIRFSYIGRKARLRFHLIRIMARLFRGAVLATAMPFNGSVVTRPRLYYCTPMLLQPIEFS